MPTLFKMRSILSFSVGIPPFPITKSTVPHTPWHCIRVLPLPVNRNLESCLMGSLPQNAPVLVPVRCSSSEAAVGACGGSTAYDGAVTAQRQGEVHVIVGPMFAGKTTALLRRMQTENGNGRRIAVIKSEKDNRYADNSVVTHDGLKMPCWALPNLAALRGAMGAEAYDQVDVIGIDEAQFFEDLYQFCRNAADLDGKTVIVAGLDGDYLRRSFGSVIDVIPLADSVTKLTARCEVCGSPASFTFRKTEETEKELIGGKDVYMPVCRQHYVRGQAVIEAARSVLKSKRTQQSCYVEAASVAK